jgi:membrane protein DedA with SNARE-associated domain
MKSIKFFIAIFFGFALSYVPNNYMDEKYQNIVFYLVIGITLIGVIWIAISNYKLKSKK